MSITNIKDRASATCIGGLIGAVVGFCVGGPIGAILVGKVGAITGFRLSRDRY